MEEEESDALLSRKELRKQKLMEYLVAKGKLKDPKSSYLRDDSAPKKPLSSKAMSVSGKENKTLANRFGHGQIKALSQASGKPVTNVLGVHNKLNVKESVQTGRQGTHLKPSTQPHLKPALKKSDAALQPATYRSNAGVPPAVWKSSKSDSTSASISASRFHSGPKSAWSCPMSTAGSRISLGCLVKTRTGLVPAVTQSLHVPSQSQARKSAPTAAVPRAAVADKFRHKTTPASVTMCKGPAAAQKSLPASALSKAARDKGVSTAAGDRKTKVPAKPSTRPSLLPPKSQTSNGLKSRCSTSSGTATLDRAKVTARGTASYQSNRRPTGSSTRPMFEREGKKNIQPVNASSRLSNQVPASSCRGFCRSAPAAIAAAAAAATAVNAVKEKSSTHANTKKGQSFENGKPPQVGLRRPVSSVTVPRPPRITSHTRQATVPMATKTPAAKAPAKAVPQTDGAKLTAAQEERMRKLREWREAKGISYKRPPMQVRAQVKPPAGELSPCGEDEVDSFITLTERALSDCIKLLEKGSPAEVVRPILLRLPPVSRKFAKFWICQARLMEQEGDLDVLPMFRDAVGIVREPLDELRTVVFEILKKKQELEGNSSTSSTTKSRAEEQSPGGQRSAETFTSPSMIPKPITELIGGEKGDSSVIKYRVTTTPGRPARPQQEPQRFNGREIRFVTPVRRSSRIHSASVHHPEPLRDHDLCVSSYKELLQEEPPLYIYTGNEALGDNVSVQLISLPSAETIHHS